MAVIQIDLETRSANGIHRRSAGVEQVGSGAHTREPTAANGLYLMGGRLIDVVKYEMTR